MTAKATIEFFPLLEDADLSKLSYFILQRLELGIEGLPDSLCREIYALLVPLLGRYRQKNYYARGAEICEYIAELAKRLKLSGFTESFSIAEDAIEVVELHIKSLKHPEHAAQLEKYLGLVITIYESYPDRRPGKRENYYESLMSWGRHLKRYAQLLTADAHPDLARIGRFHAQAVMCTKNYFYHFQNNDNLKSLTETAWHSANALIQLGCFEVTFNILEDIVSLLQKTEIFGKQWFLGKIHNGLADAYEATQNWQQQFTHLKLSYYFYSLTNDHRNLERIHGLLIKSTEGTARQCFMKGGTLEQRERGWQAARNSLLLAMHFRDQKKLEELIEEFGQYVNVPELIVLVRQDMEIVDNTLPLKPFSAVPPKPPKSRDLKERDSREKDAKRGRDYDDRPRDERSRLGYK
ncbi:MAG: hypothetical protein M3R00_08420 [Pseudomonadota bacterium]|nr:hypothetical protein [Pseudomonadota bacterium]